MAWLTSAEGSAGDTGVKRRKSYIPETAGGDGHTDCYKTGEDSDRVSYWRRATVELRQGAGVRGGFGGGVGRSHLSQFVVTCRGSRVRVRLEARRAIMFPVKGTAQAKV